MDTTFQQTVERYGAVLYRLAFSYCGNRPDAEDAVYANLLIYKNRVVGADVCSAKLEGFMHGLAKP